MIEFSSRLDDLKQERSLYNVISSRNLPEEYANLFHLTPQADAEDNAAFRFRVACELHKLGKTSYAEEALTNSRRSAVMGYTVSSGPFLSVYTPEEVRKAIYHADFAVATTEQLWLIATVIQVAYDHVCELDNDIVKEEENETDRRNRLLRIPAQIRWLPIPLTWKERLCKDR